ncbi:MAG: YiiX/YebB-like N1pC/P60 family cysteine hydrolase [Syntrophaceticus sp.]
MGILINSLSIVLYYKIVTFSITLAVVNEVISLRQLKTTLIVIAILFLSLQSAQLIEKHYQSRGEYPPTWIQLLSSAGKGNFGTGKFSSTPNNLDLSILEPGDILLGGNPGGSYGHYTHAGMYVGNNQVVTMYTSTGVRLEPSTAYLRYHWATVARVKASPQQKKEAVSYCRSQIGGPFFILTPKKEDGLWYCSKLIWFAYLKQGIDLDPFNSYWILPDAFVHSPYTQVLDKAEVH